MTEEGSGWAESWDGLGLTELLGTTRTGNQDSQVEGRIALVWSHQRNGMTEVVTTWVMNLDMCARKQTEVSRVMQKLVINLIN